MKISLPKPLLLGAALALLAPQALRAQEYFRTLATPEDLATVQVPTAEQEEKYNLRLGSNIGVNVAAGVALEFNDNINLAPNGQRKSDIIFRPSVEFDSAWRISDLNVLRFSLGLSYAKYFDHSQFDTRGVLLSPNSALELTVHVGEVSLTFRERFSYQEDPFDLPILSGVAVYRRFENQVGVQADWDINERIKLTAGYDHYNLWALDSQFQDLSRAVDTLYVKPTIVLGPNLSTGVSISGSFITFEHPGQNDGVGISVGPFVDINLNESTRLYAEAGFQEFTFDRGGSINDNGDSTSWYGRLEVTNRLSDNLTQHLSFSKNAEIGFGQNFYTLYHVEYGAEWKVNPSLSLDPTAFYEHYTTSGQGAETADRYGFALGARYVLTPSITLGLDYRFLLKDSNLPQLGYQQNLVLLSAFYSF